MEVILLERVARLGQMGDVVRVKDGFARNFLLPRGKALRATAENRTRFETMKGDLEARSLTLKTEAAQVAEKLDGKSFTVLRQASEAGQLFGSVSPRDLVTLIGDAGFRINRNQIALNAPIKTIGQHKVPISLHPEVESTITVIVARNEDEAARIARGEDVTQLREATEAEAAVIAAEEFFEPGAGEASRQDERRGSGRKPAGIRKELIGYARRQRFSVRDIVARHGRTGARLLLRRSRSACGRSEFGPSDLGAGFGGSAALGLAFAAGAAREPAAGSCVARRRVFRFRLAFPACRFRHSARAFPARRACRVVLALGFFLFRPLLLLGLCRCPHRMGRGFGLAGFGLLGPGVLHVRLLLRGRFGAAGAEDISGKRRGLIAARRIMLAQKRRKHQAVLAGGQAARRLMAGRAIRWSKSRLRTCPGRC